MMAAQFFYNRNYNNLTPSEQSNLYKNLNSIEKDENGNLLFNKGLRSSDINDQLQNTKKKPISYKKDGIAPAHENSPEFIRNG